MYPSWYRAFYKWLADYESLLRTIAEEKTPVASGEAKMNPEPDDKGSVPISDAEAYRAMDAVSRVNTLREMGIFATTKWRIEAHCRFHGVQSMTLDTNEEIPEGTWLRCFGCLGNGKTRWLEISERKRITEEETTE